MGGKGGRESTAMGELGNIGRGCERRKREDEIKGKGKKRGGGGIYQNQKKIKRSTRETMG